MPRGRITGGKVRVVAARRTRGGERQEEEETPTGAERSDASDGARVPESESGSDGEGAEPSWAYASSDEEVAPDDPVERVPPRPRSRQCPLAPGIGLLLCVVGVSWFATRVVATAEKPQELPDGACWASLQSCTAACDLKFRPQVTAVGAKFEALLLLEEVDLQGRVAPVTNGAHQLFCTYMNCYERCSLCTHARGDVTALCHGLEEEQRIAVDAGLRELQYGSYERLGARAPDDVDWSSRGLALQPCDHPMRVCGVKDRVTRGMKDDVKYTLHFWREGAKHY